MCPMCLAAGGLYVAGGVSAGAVATFLATKWLGKRTERNEENTDERLQEDEDTPDRHA